MKWKQFETVNEMQYVIRQRYNKLFEKDVITKKLKKIGFVIDSDGNIRSSLPHRSCINNLK